VRKWRFPVTGDLVGSPGYPPVKKRRKEKSSNGLKTQLLDIESKILTITGMTETRKERK
jgi:hypothetical protein